MNEENKILIGNFTTIMNSLLLALAGLIIGALAGIGINLPIDQYGLSAIIGLVIFTIFGYYNAKYHNTFFNKDEDYLQIKVDGLTPEQIQTIQNFIDNASTINITEEIKDIDPSLDYEELQ